MTVKKKYKRKSGGTTLSLFIRRGSLDNWIVNLGDSEIVMFDKSSKVMLYYHMPIVLEISMSFKE